jgi:hypothetical protein
VQKERGKEKLPVIPLSLNGTKLGVLEDFFGEEPIYIPVTSDAGGIEGAMDAILVAVGKRLPSAPDRASEPQPKTEPLEELVLELSEFRFQEQDGVRRASARARLVYEPATQGQPDVHSAQQWRLIAPIGPIEAEELRWYLEQYAIWPSGIAVIQERARRVEASLKEWGQLLYQQALPLAHTANVIKGLDQDRPPRRAALFHFRRYDLGGRCARGRGCHRPRGRHTRAGPALGAAPRRQALPLSRRQAHPCAP